MANLLDTGAAWLLSQLQSHAGRSVTYTQLGQAAIDDITATRAVEEVQIVDAQGMPTVVTVSAWLIASTDLDGITPKRGDTVTETTSGGDVVIWEVAPRPNGPLWQYEDAGRNMLRVYAVEVG